MTAVHDPLLETIRIYQAGLAEFNRLADADPDDKRWHEFEDATFGPPLARLQQWKGPATSMAGAIAALQVALEEKAGVSGTDAETRMVKAALDYLESAFPASTATDRAPSIFALLAEYWAAFDALTVEDELADSVASGTPEDDAAQKRLDEAGERLNAIALRLCAFVPQSPIGAKYKTQFLHHFAAEYGGGLNSDATAALLSSLPGLIPYCGGSAE